MIDLTKLTPAPLTKEEEAEWRAKTKSHPWFDWYPETVARIFATLDAERAASKRLRAELDLPVCRMQFPDGSAPGNAREAAEGWKEWHDRTIQEMKRIRESNKELAAASLEVQECFDDGDAGVKYSFEELADEKEARVKRVRAGLRAALAKATEGDGERAS